MAFNNTIVARVAASVWGLKLGNATMQAALNQANFEAGGLTTVINGAFNDSFPGVTNANIAASFVNNLGLTGAAATAGVDYVVAELGTVAATARGAKLSEIASLFSSLTADPTFGAAAIAFNAKVAAATAYSGTAGSQDAPLGFLPSNTSFFLTTGQDNMTGTPGADTFTAYIFDNQNSLQSADRLDGGAGEDALYADMGSSQNFSVTPITSAIEKIIVRAESEATVQGQNNVSGTARVQIDAERIAGENWYESNNSRSDVIIEDVRIADQQITKDITIAMVETDPGNVDYGVYFDQYSLRNQTSATSSINLRIMDTVAAAAGKAPLLNSNYGAFTFTVTGTDGVSRVVTLGSKAIQDAQTYAEMAAAFQAQLDVAFGPGAASATVGENFTVTDPDSRQPVTGQAIVLTTKTATVFTTPAGSGWLADGTAPPASNFYTQFTTGQTKSTSLVTSTVILDDVGRGSTSGDLLIGGLSTGASSTSLGVQRFEVEVRDNSKLQSMSSTNNSLREVTFVNGVTTSQSFAYVDTVKDAGNITVNGNAGPNGQNVSGMSGRTQVGTTTTPDAQLPGTSQSNAFGFADVRLIDASAMRGKVEFTADVTARSLQKYLNLRDIQALPAGDNVAFTYTGGVNDDTLWVRLDTDAVSSRSTIMAGREDFTFTVTGGNGNDWLNVGLNTPPGGLQAWYNNQKLNKNITVDGGAGDDVIRTPGAGDKIILAGTGNDVVYADNTGNQNVNAQTSSRAGAAYAAAEAAELAAAIAAQTLSNDTNSAATGTLSNPLRQPDATVAALDTLNLVTPVTHNDPAVPAAPNPLLPTRAALIAAVDAAFAAGALTVQQQQALIAPAGYNLRTGDTITVPTTEVRPALVPGAAVAGALTAAEFAAGNALLDGYITAAKAAAATAQAADDVLASQLALLNVTQAAVVTATLAVNGIASVQAGSVNGTAVNLANLNALKGALIVGTTDAQLVAALTTAVDNGAVTGPLGAGQANALFTAATSAGAGVMDAAELFAVQVILEPLVAGAVTANTTANTALTNAITANNTAVRAAANIVGANPTDPTNQSNVGGDSVGSTEAAAAQATAEAALTAFNTATLTPATTLQTQLSALKSALSVGVSDLNFSLITAGVSAAVNAAFGGSAAAVLNPLSFAGPALIAGTVSATEKETIDREIQIRQEINNADVATAQARAATLTANVTATTFAAAQALQATNSSPNSGFNAEAQARAVWVLNTSNQLNPSNTAYVYNVNDERNIADLRSDVDNTYNMFATRLTVTFKDLTATVTVPNTGYRTSDLQINQAIKDAINNDAVLKTLLDATDGPANSLVITSRIDGVMSNTNLAIAVTLPGTGVLPLGDINAAATAYGVAQTEAAVLAAMATALTSYNTKGDYVDQIAETGAFGGNAALTGANSTTTADNTITPGDGNDVIVLGTTSDATSPGNALLSSNDTVVYGANFGNDTIVHFRAGSLVAGGDILNLSAVGGNVLTAAFNVNRSVTVANEVTLTNNTPALVAGLFVDSATAQTHVYVAVDTTTNIGKVYTVTDTAGVASGSVTAVLAGTIDLADTLWASLTAENFG